MFRKTLTILSLIGLLLSVGLWGASYLSINYSSFNGQRVVGIEDGAAYFSLRAKKNITIVNAGISNSAGVWMLWKDSGAVGEHQSWRVNGLRYDRMQSRKTTWWVFFLRSGPKISGGVVALWIPTAVLLCLNAWLLHPYHRRRRRRKLGLCLKCGYDLRASKERCPECGTGFLC
ncbi:MAG: hypothetical protein IIB58_12635 [Planctomycetes bacterium]|nr:hypothetical protein [Planctomycetota bacterium]